MDLYTDMTLVRSMLGSETSPFPVWTPCRGARGSEPEYYGLCARSHYCHHPGVPIYNYGWCYRHHHCCTVTCSQNSLSHLTHAGTHIGWPVLPFSQSVERAASRGRRHTRNYHLLGQSPSALTGQNIPPPLLFS